MVSCWAICRLALAINSIIICFAGSIVFIIFQNYLSVVLAVISGVTSGLLAHLHLLNVKGRLNQWYSRPELLQIGRLGFVVFCIGIFCITYNTVFQIMLQKPILPVPQSVIIPIVWSAITVKSGLFLLYYSHNYIYVEEDNQVLVTPEEPEAFSEDDGVIHA